MSFRIVHKDKHTQARIGILKTKSGTIETPFFMPVATKATVKFISPHTLEKLGTKAIISNAFILSLRPGSELIKKSGGIKKFMHFSGINFTDSGGFQMYSDSLYLKSDDNSVHFRNPLSGENIFMTPEQNMKLQLEIGADVALCLDSMPLYKNSKEEIFRAVTKTIEWAARCKKEHDYLQKNIHQSKRQLLFAISQGGVYSDLREVCVKELLKHNFDGYAIGGVALPEALYGGTIEKVKKQEQKVITVHKKIVPADTICYLMGEGDPVWMLEAIALGVDCFDSRMPTQSARRGTLFTTQGKMKILNKKYKANTKPIDPVCQCFVCQHYSRAYVRHLLKEKESVGMELASCHNIYYIHFLIDQAKQAIKKNKLRDFVWAIKKKYRK